MHSFEILSVDPEFTTNAVASMQIALLDGKSSTENVGRQLPQYRWIQ